VCDCGILPAVTMGLDGILPWQQAHHIAQTVALPLNPISARLDEAIGAVLARAVELPVDDPVLDVAAHQGFAVCGGGPWTITEADTLRPGMCQAVEPEDQLPGHTDAVIETAAVEKASADSILMRDPLTQVVDERARPQMGEGIVPRGSRARAGHPIVGSRREVTPAILALAAAAGLDTIDIVKPPVVGTIVLGRTLLSHGLPREGRVRDALGFTIPAFVGQLGGRGNPPVRAADTAELLIQEIQDAQADLIITTGSTEPAADNYVRQVLRDLGAHWLIDGVACTPGAQMLLARLPDGRLHIGVPGEPTAALAALVTLVAPVVTGLRGGRWPERLPTAVLFEPAPPADYAEDARLAPVRIETIGQAKLAHPLRDSGPAGLLSWAQADAIAVVPPGAGSRGDVVSLLMPPIPYGGVS
jgi:molybdopterin molybdotransferase